MQRVTLKSMNVITILGVRPQFVKAAPVSAALAAAGVQERILHTGQHYDPEMSDVFFRQLGIPGPVWHLEMGGGSHGAMTGAMLMAIEPVLQSEKPDMVIVFGDTNTTLAGALAAAKLHIPVAHVESGLRSFNRAMPEEINRICTDHISDLLFCSSANGVEQLRREGITRGVHLTGDVMADIFEATRRRVAQSPPAWPDGLPDKFVLLTLHREENTGSATRLASIFRGVAASAWPVVFPVHPRTAQAIRRMGLEIPDNLRCVEPQSYDALVHLLENSEAVLTDSGGLQKEAYWAGRRCITLRDETEWTETLATGWNVLAGAGEAEIAAALAAPCPAGGRPALYGDGQAAGRIAAVIAAFAKSAN